MNRASVFEWHKRFKAGRESVRDDEGCGRSKEVRIPGLIGERVRLGLLCWGFKWVHQEIPSDEATSLQIGSMAFPPRQCSTMHHNSILVTDYLNKIGIKTVPQPPYRPELGPCDFWLFPKLSGCLYETIEEMKEALTKIIETLTQDDFHGASQKLLERCSRWRLLQRGLEFDVCTINKSTHTKKVWKLIVCTS